MTELGPTIIHPDGAYGYGSIEGFPLDGEVTSPFGPREPIQTPQGPTSNFHSGVDLWRWGIEGAPIQAPAPCLVKASYKDTAGGQTVAVEYEDGTGSMFVHMEGLQAGVGMQLDRGALIGLVGTSGLSTAPHLHYMRMRFCGNGAIWYSNDQLIDPLGPEGGHVPILSDPHPAPLPDVVEGDWPAPGQIGMVVVTEDANAPYVVAQAYREGRPVASLHVLVDGAWLVYIVGAPDAVNAHFPTPIPGNTALFVRAAG